MQFDLDNRLKGRLGPTVKLTIVSIYARDPLPVYRFVFLHNSKRLVQVVELEDETPK